MTVQLLEILRRSEQGITRPFICRGDDDVIYFVKGRGAGRHSLIAEYVCGQLATSFGLPIADFALVNASKKLIQTSLMHDIGELGSGLAFGSKSLSHVQELDFQQSHTLNQRTCRDVLVFDWWVRNSDRTMTEHSGNPNLLWNQDEQQLIVIDHNTAFEIDFDRQAFAKNHAFASLLPIIFADLAERASYIQRIEHSLLTFDSACDNVPLEWWSVDDGVPALFDKDAVKLLLSNYKQDSFWSLP